MVQFAIFIFGLIIASRFNAAQDMQEFSPDLGTTPGDLMFPIEADSSSNASIISLVQLFPFGANFTVTSFDYLSPSNVVSRSTGALYLDEQMGLFRSQESLRQYLGGAFRLRVTVVSAETGIQTAEEIRLPVVDKTYRAKLTMNKNAQIAEEHKFEILAQLKNTVDIKGKNLEFIPEKVHRIESRNGKLDVDQSELCFYVVQASGFPIAAREILPHLQRDRGELMIFFLEKYQIQRVSFCSSDLWTSSLRMDGLSIGLLVLAIILSIFLVGAIIFVCCWLRMKKLHAAVLAAQPTQPALSLVMAPSQFTAPKLPAAYHVEAPMSISQWSALSIPTFSYGMKGLAQKPRRPPSSCDAHYEWQESSLDLAGDADSINRSINDAVNHTTSSSAPSITEDSVSVGQHSMNNQRCHSPENTAL